jgi:hypothetical protein
MLVPLRSMKIKMNHPEWIERVSNLKNSAATITTIATIERKMEHLALIVKGNRANKCFIFNRLRVTMVCALTAHLPLIIVLNRALSATFKGQGCSFLGLDCC